MVNSFHAKHGQPDRPRGLGCVKTAFQRRILKGIADLNIKLDVPLHFELYIKRASPAKGDFKLSATREK